MLYTTQCARLTMVAAAEHSPSSDVRSILVDDRICSMPADIVEGLDNPFLVLNEDEVKVGEFEAEVTSEIR